MRKTILVALFALFGMSAMNAQGQFNVGAFGGLPIGDAGDFATFAIGLDLSYMFEVSDDFEVGPVTGLSHSFGDEITILGVTLDVNDVTFLPIGGGFRFNAAESFSLGGDVGYAIGINDGNDGGFYYAPRAAYNVSEAVAIVAAFRGVAVDGGSWDIISLGVEFGID